MPICKITSSTVLSSVTLHTYRGQNRLKIKIDWQNLVFMNMQVTCKYSSITMTIYWDFLPKIETNAHLKYET